MRTPLLVSILALATLSLLAPPAWAHSTTATDDGKFFVTVGNQNEPVTTWTKTGLDLIIRANESGERGDEIADAHQTLSATLVSPSGEEFTDDLRTQHGAVGRYSFTEPYVLTESGQYKLRLVGDINGSPVDGEYNVAGPVPEWGDHTFPAEAMTPTELAAENEELRQQIADLEARMEALETNHDDMSAANGEAPGVGPLVVLVGLVLAIALVRRRAA